VATSIVVHAGANKTGSSAIQNFLSLNHVRLRQDGVLVPDENFSDAETVPGNHVFAFKPLLDSPTDGRPRFEAAMDALAGSTDAGTILVSAENLAANPNGPLLFENLARRYDVRLIMYIRRQDDYLLSTWRQWQFKIRKDFWAWVVQEVGTSGDWKSYLEPWAHALGPEKVRVRVYERQRLVHGDVVDDFYALLGVTTPLDDLQRPPDRVNPSLSDAVTDLVKANPLIFQNVHDNDFQQFVTELTGDRYLATADDSWLTLEQRRAIVKRYERSNEWVRQQYFAAEDGLFAPPATEHGTQQDDPIETKLEFLTTLIYRLYRQQTGTAAGAAGTTDGKLMAAPGDAQNGPPDSNPAKRRSLLRITRGKQRSG
jgi:hypothetical protein